MRDFAMERALVRRVASSRHFVKAHQLRDILLYLAERALDDPFAAIHEQEIACTVLSRKPDFNPHEDNIVRVQVSHVRKRLDEYFRGEGRDESVVVSVPRGGYTLRFESRPALPAVPVSVVSETQPAPPKHGFPRGVLAFSIAAGMLVVCGAALYLRSLFPAAPARAVPGTDEAELLWTGMFTGKTASIVVADTCLVMLQDILDTDIPLASYINGQYPAGLLSKVPDRGLQTALRTISTRQYTSLADLNSAHRFTELSHRYAANPPAIRYARYMNVRDFKSGNFILMGSRRGIPWVRLFESQLNFSMEEDPATKSYFYRNRTPRPGEPAAWYQEAKADTTVETYADVALAPNLANTGYVLILSGIGMEASEAAGEFVAGPEFQKALAALLPKAGGRGPSRYFELLLRTRAVAGAARSSQVVTSRILPVPAAGL